MGPRNARIACSFIFLIKAITRCTCSPQPARFIHLPCAHTVLCRTAASSGASLGITRDVDQVHQRGSSVPWLAASTSVATPTIAVATTTCIPSTHFASLVKSHGCKTRGVPTPASTGTASAPVSSPERTAACDAYPPPPSPPPYASASASVTTDAVRPRSLHASRSHSASLAASVSLAASASASASRATAPNRRSAPRPHAPRDR